MNSYLLNNEIALLINLISHTKMLIRKKKKPKQNTHKEKWHLPGILLLLLQLPVRKVAKSYSAAGVTHTQGQGSAGAPLWVGIGNGAVPEPEAEPGSGGSAALRLRGFLLPTSLGTALQAGSNQRLRHRCQVWLWWEDSQRSISRSPISKPTPFLKIIFFKSPWDLFCWIAHFWVNY